jgi:hypothetical protein
VPKGFGNARSPRIWLQLIHKDGTEKFLRFDGCDRNIQSRCIRLLKNSRNEYILVLRGTADIHDVQRSDVLADYQRDARSGTVRVQ